MPESHESEVREERVRPRNGLEILYLKPDPKVQLTGVAERDLAGELRERYWIQAAEDQGVERKNWANVGISMPVPIERHELGRNRNEPGDGFRYVFRSGTAGTGGRAEWFEVTEVFEGVTAKNIEAFMRVENGGEAGFEFDPTAFVDGLSTWIPSRAAQQRAADKVIDAIERKLYKASYEGMWQEHGYGTLIVGLPLWFAAQPLNPLRPENVVDDFTTRVQLGLKPYTRRLRKKRCPFWRIVVVWSTSVESTSEWCRKARLDVYDDPAYDSLRSTPMKYGTMMPVLLEVMGKLEDVEPGPDGPTRATLSVFAVIRKKKRKADLVRLPPAVE